MTHTIGIVGYGNQGKSWAANLRDEGWCVTILARSESTQKQNAIDDGFPVAPLNELGRFNTLALLIPDDAMPVFLKQNETYLVPHQSLVFAHGYTLHFKTAPWPKSLDLILVAPKGIGAAVREKYVQNSGVPAVLAVTQDVSGHAWKTAKKVAQGLGCDRVGTYEATAAEEVESDLFSEQALLCGGLPALIAETFQTLTNEGIRPEVAYLECVHELAFIADLIQKRGIHGMLQMTSPTARYGGIQGAQSFRTPELKKTLHKIFQAIRNQDFSNQMKREAKHSFSDTKREMDRWKKSLIETTGSNVREKLFKKS